MKQEKELLLQTFQATFEKVKHSRFHKLFAEEKYKHSLQVLGCGNYILKNEPIFQKKSKKYIKLAKTALLFHDLARFNEIELKLENGSKFKCDHSIMGYEMLKAMPEYCDERITIPIKHHGHMIEALYEDEEYQKSAHKQEIEEIIKLVRDADKIANFQIIKTDMKKFRDVFLHDVNPEIISLPITPKMIEIFLQEKVITSKYIISMADKILNMISWIFDINYNSSFKYIRQNKGIENLLKHLAQFNKNITLQKQIEIICHKKIGPLL